MCSAYGVMWGGYEAKPQPPHLIKPCQKWPFIHCGTLLGINRRVPLLASATNAFNYVTGCANYHHDARNPANHNGETELA
jgi:hypothetical protein